MILARYGGREPLAIALAVLTLWSPWHARAQASQPRHSQAMFEVRIAYDRRVGSLVASCATQTATLFTAPAKAPASAANGKGSSVTARLSCLSTVLASAHWPGAAPEGRSFVGAVTLDEVMSSLLEVPANVPMDALSTAAMRTREIEVKF